MERLEPRPSAEELKRKVLEQFLVEYEEKMLEETLYAPEELDLIEKLRQGEKIRWDVQGGDLLAKISQNFRLTPEEGIALRIEIFENAPVPTWYEEENNH